MSISIALKELRRILPLPRTETRCNKRAVGIMMFTYAMTGLGYIWITVLDTCVPKIYFKDTLGSDIGTIAFSAGFTGLSYFVPILAGGFADTKFGRYETLIFGKVMKFIGTALRVIIILLLHFQKINVNGIESYILQGSYVLSTFLIYLSIWIVLPVSVVFGAMQMDQTNDAALTSFFRWGFFFTYVGFTVGSFVWICMILNGISQAQGIMIYTTMILVADGLSAAVLIFGKATFSRYNREGKRSFLESCRILKIHILKFRPPQEPVTINPDEFSLRTLKRRLERLMARKRILLVALLAASSLFQMCWFAILYDLDIYTYDDSGHMNIGVSGEILRDAVYITPLIAVPIFELFGRIGPRQCSLKTEYNRIFKVIGIGSFFFAISVFIGGVVHMLIRTKGLKEVSMFWQIPEFVLIGVASTFVFASVFEFSYRESLPGLGTMTTGISFALGFGVSTTLVFLIHLGKADSTFGIDEAEEYELYGLALGMAVISVIAFLPVSIWFRKTKELLQTATKELDDRMQREEDNRRETLVEINSVVLETETYDFESDTDESVGTDTTECVVTEDKTNDEEMLLG